MANRTLVDVDLTPFVSRLVPEWVSAEPNSRHRKIPGTLVFTDLSGFTAMSERLAALGKVGAEEMTHHLDATFTELVSVSGGLGGTMLKFGGDALLIFFWGDNHERRAARAALDMQATLDRIGHISTSAGDIQLRMTVGAHCGEVDFFLLGSSHRELFVCGEAASITVDVEGQAEPGEVRVSEALAARLSPEQVDFTHEPALLVGSPAVDPGYTSWPAWPDGIGPNRFVPEMLRNHLASGVELHEHRQMVVGFLHLANVDELIEDIGADATAIHLSDLMAHVQAAFANHGIAFVSTDVYHGGPKILCATGAVRTFGNDDERLLRGLREVVEYPSPIELRVGVNRGHGFCGYVGPAFRRSFVTIGDVVNTSARVMSKAGAGEILSTQGALDRSETLFELEELAAFQAKGKAEPLVPFRVGPIIGTRVQDNRHRVSLIGRDDELAWLLDRLAETRMGTGRFVEIRGETGIGKTRLIEEFIAHVDVDTVEARCGRYAGSTPYFPFRTLVASLVGGDTVEALTSAVRAKAADLEPYVPLLALLLGHTVAHTSEIERLGPTEQREKLHSSLAELVASFGPDPVMWLVEDAHWIDAASSDLLHHLATNIEGLPLLMCVTARPDESDAIAGSDTVLDLAPLSVDAAVSLLNETSTTHLLTRELSKLAERAHGNPYFLIELARAEANADLDHLPDSLEAMIAARIDALPPADLLVLRQLAVVGSRFDPRVAAEAVDALPAQRDARWRNLDDFIDRAERPWSFRQTLVRDTAYEGLSYRERKVVHGRTGDAIERHAVDPSMVCELLSLHFDAAENHIKSLKYSNEAGQKARQSYALAETATFYRRGVSAARVLEDRVALGDALTGLGWAELDQGHYDRARAPFEESLEIKRSLGNRQGVAAQLNGLGLVARSIGEYDTAHQLFEECVGILRALDKPESLGAALHNLGQVAWLKGDYPTAGKWFDESLLVNQDEGNRGGVARSLNALGVLALISGDHPLAIERLTAYLDVSRELGDKPGIASALNNLGSAAIQQGDLDAARTHFETSIGIQRELGNRQGVANALLNLGMVAHFGGQYDVARERYEASLAILHELGDRQTIAQCLHNLGEAALAEGNRAETRRYCEDSLAIRREIGDRRGIAEDLTTLGTVALESDHNDVASTVLCEALGIHHDLGNKLGLAECFEAVASATAAAGDGPRAATLLGAADAIVDSTNATRGWAPEKRDALVKNLRRKLGASVFEMTLHVGRAMSIERAIELARGALVEQAPIESATA